MEIKKYTINIEYLDVRNKEKITLQNNNFLLLILDFRDSKQIIPNKVPKYSIL